MGKVRRIWIFLLLSALILLLGALVAHAQDQKAAQNDGMDQLRAYLVEAAENNPDLQAAFASWKASAERAPQVSTLPDPKFTYAYFIQPVETRTGPQRHKFGISQSFPWFGKLSIKERKALQESEAKLARAEDIRLSVYYDVKRAFYDYAYLAQALEIARQNLELVRYFENMISSRYASGLSPYSDLIKIQVELGKLEDRVRTLEDLRRPVAARLNAAMNRAVDEPLPLPEAVPVMVITLGDSELLEGIRENNPKVKELGRLTASGQSGIDLAHRNYYPDFTLGLETIDQDRARAGDPINNGENPIIASVSVNVPIWQEPRDAAVREAEARKSAARLSMIGTEQRLSADMELALYKYRDAGRKIDLYRDTLIPKAEQTLGVVLESFQTGKGNSLDLIEAEETLLELELAYVRALADQGQRFAEMERIFGKEIPCEIHGVTVEAYVPPNGGRELAVSISNNDRNSPVEN